MLRRLSFIIQIKKSIPFIIDFFRSAQVSLTKKSSIIFLFVGYFVLPFDLIPDFIPFFGMMDELALLGFILNYVVKIAPSDLKEKFGI